MRQHSQIDVHFYTVCAINVFTFAIKNKLSNKMKLLCLLIFTLLVSNCNVGFGRIDWQEKLRNWAYNCTFVGRNLSHSLMPGEKCGSHCREVPSCTHFVWESGICWLKKGYVRRNDAISSEMSGIVCGIKVIEWREDWAPNCKFPGPHFKAITPSASRHCTDHCGNTIGCTHFIWQNETCFLKNGTFKVEDAELLSDSHCGFVLDGRRNSSIFWQDGNWAHDCAFDSSNLTSGTMIGNFCGPFCWKTPGCTHFTWININTTCIAHGGPVSKSQAVWKQGYVCGFKELDETTSTVAPPLTTTTHIYKTSDTLNRTNLLVVAIVPSMLVVIVAVVVCWWFVYSKGRFDKFRLSRICRPPDENEDRYKGEQQPASPNENQNFIEIAASSYTNSSVISAQSEICNESIERMSPDKFRPKHRFSAKSFTLLQTLGSGAFGVVYKAKPNQSKNQSRDEFVAFKSTRTSGDEIQNKMLEGEFKLLSYIGSHDNIVGLVGIAVADVDFSLVLEFCDGGSLKAFLDKLRFQKNVKDKSEERLSRRLVGFAKQISDGMEFIQSRKCIHRDLAARNILLSNNETVAKITDFGLSKNVYSKGLYEINNKTFPWPWYAPEALTNAIYFFESDTWSFGVLFWEILSLGQHPFIGVDFSEKFIAELEQGRRLEKPVYADDKLYALMNMCWEWIPCSRPSFTAISEEFRNWLNGEVEIENE